MNEQTSGRINQVLGNVVDVEFSNGSLPPILSALRVSNPSIDDRAGNLVLEVEQHLGGSRARCMAIDPPEASTRGMEGMNSGATLAGAGGATTRGRQPKVTGEQLNEGGPAGKFRCRPSVLAPTG